jgi:hypothetical protein
MTAIGTDNRPADADDPWLVALDDFEQRLAGFRQVLDHDKEPIPGDWPPPTVTGRQLPAALVPRARALLAAAGDLENQIKVRQETLRVRASTHAPRRRSFTGRPSRSMDL